MSFVILLIFIYRFLYAEIKDQHKYCDETYQFNP